MGKMQPMRSSDSAPGHRRSVPMYVGAGGIATACHYAATIASVELLGIPPLAASAGGFAVGAVVKYWLNYSVAFRSQASHRSASPRFAVALALLMAANTVLFGLLQGGLGLHYILAQVLTTALLVPPGYAIHRYWVFRAC
jgi:putative flippase GtrA